MTERLSFILSSWDRLNRSVSAWLERIAIVAVVGMILGTLIDVMGAKLFQWPMPAGTEVIYLLQVITIAGAIAITKIDGGHVRIEYVDSLPRRGRAFFSILASILGLSLFIILCWQSYLFAQSMRINNEVTATARIVLYPFVLWVALCCIPVVSILLKELISTLLEISKK
jgi:TRAP-type C4-dicarboxylate transport system permease small subunit